MYIHTYIHIFINIKKYTPPLLPSVTARKAPWKRAGAVYTRTHIHIWVLHIYVYIYLCIYEYMYLCIYIHVCMYTYPYTHMCSTHIYIYIYMYLFMYKYTYKHVSTNTRVSHPLVSRDTNVCEWILPLLSEFFHCGFILLDRILPFVSGFSRA